MHTSLGNGDSNALLQGCHCEPLTTFLAGFAFTTTTLPNISLLPAFVAGLVFSFNIARPGTVNLPVDLTSFVPTAARLASTFLQSPPFKPVAAAIAAVMPDWDMAVM